MPGTITCAIPTNYMARSSPTVTLGCDAAGYTGTTTATCDATGTWVPGTCTPATCSTAVPNVPHVVSATPSPPTALNAQFTMNCSNADGYFGTRTVMCNGQDTWSLIVTGACALGTLHLAA